MSKEYWIDPKSHYQAAGWVTNGRMSDAEVTDNNGFTRDRNRTFESKDAFFTWARKEAGINW